MSTVTSTAAELTHERALLLAEQVVARCRELACITEVAGETTRTFLSQAMQQANSKVAEWMRLAGCSTAIDAAGNLRGTLRGTGALAGSFILGSHLDTVPNAGAFDGVLGVVLAVALAEVFGPSALSFDLEIVGFSEEEGVRFGFPFIGSRGLTGTLTEEMLERKDPRGQTVRDALLLNGLDPALLPSAQVKNALGYLEFHIEQGPALESEGLPLGVVETIAGQSRWMLTFTGSAGHAGTTPMHLRKDALSAAAEWIVEVERFAAEHRALVATCGSIHVLPNAGNVIAGEARVSLDVRSALDAVRIDGVEALLQIAKAIATRRGIAVSASLLLEQPAVAMDRNLLHRLEDAVDATGTPIRRIVSGAGHDAMIVAPHTPASMLFLRSPGGLSHHPEEAVHTADVALALQAGALFLRGLAEKEQTS